MLLRGGARQNTKIGLLERALPRQYHSERRKNAVIGIKVFNNVYWQEATRVGSLGKVVARSGEALERWRAGGSEVPGVLCPRDTIVPPL